MSVESAPSSSHSTSLSIGIIAALFTASMQSLGLVLQRRSHSSSSSSPTLKSLTWYFGLFLFIFSQLFGSTIALGELPILVLAPLSSSNLVFNAIFASFFASESMNMLQIFGCLLIAISSTTFTILGYSPESSLHLSQLIQNSISIPFLINITIQFSFISILLIFFILPSLQTIHSQNSTHEIISELNQKIGISFGMISGITSAQSFLLGKCLIELGKVSILEHQHNQYQYIGSCILLILIGIYSIVNIVVLNESLKYQKITLIVPFSFSIFCGISTLNALSFFTLPHNFLSLSRSIILLCALMGILVGVILLNVEQNSDQTVTHKNELEDEAIPLISP